MSLLSDQELAGLVRSAPSMVDGLDLRRLGLKRSPIQPASIDLTIGEIYTPGAVGDQFGSIGNPQTVLCLQQGQTAVVSTAETLHIPDDIGAIGFPPANVSIKGLLTTNPGHIDPGFNGKLHFTIINMGKASQELRRGDPIVTLLFLRMRASAAYPYHALQPSGAGQQSPGINAELLNSLSHDFMDFEARTTEFARQAVRAEVNRVNRWSVTTPIIAAIVSAVVIAIASLTQPWNDVSDRVTTLESRFEAIGSTIDLGELTDRIEKLELEIKELENANANP